MTDCNYKKLKIFPEGFITSLSLHIYYCILPYLVPVSRGQPFKGMSDCKPPAGGVLLPALRQELDLATPQLQLKEVCSRPELLQAALDGAVPAPDSSRVAD